MEFTLLSSLLTCAITAILIYAWQLLKWVWITPRCQETMLRRHGFSGNSYNLLFGDFKHMKSLIREAYSRPMNFTNDIVPRVYPLFHDALKKYGENCYIWFGPRAGVLITNPEVVREVLQKNFVFQKPSGNPLGRLLAKGVVAYETDKWAKHRKLINPAFQIEKIKRMVPSFYLSCAEMLTKWEQIVPSHGSCELDVWPYIQTMTSDVISRTAFGSNYEEGRRIFELQNELAVLVMEATRSLYVPGLRFFPTKRNWKMKQLAKEVETSILEIANRRMKAMKAGDKCNDDLLDLLLESNMKEMEQHGSKFGMSLKDVIEECKLFYFAGQETTASLLVWTLILLSKHQDWQARARDEVLRVFGRGKLDYQEINQLKIINMIVHEVLRLYPPGPVIPRVTPSECKFGEITYPAGVQMMIPVLLVHHDRRIWGDDALEFNPERFGEGMSKAARGGPALFPFGWGPALFPFGWGPRICPGQNFALLESRLSLAMILQRFSFGLSGSYVHAPHTVVTLRPQHGAHLIVERL